MDKINIDLVRFKTYTFFMAIEELDVDGFIRFLRDKQGGVSDRQYAQSLGITPSYLCDVYNQRTIPGDKITSGLAAMNVDARRSVTVTYLVNTEEKKEKS